MRVRALVGFPTLVLMLFVAASAQQPAPAKAPAKPQVVAAIAQTKETQAAITPQMALQILKDGNERFVSGTMKKRDLRKQVNATSTGQFPFARLIVVLGHSDCGA